MATTLTDPSLTNPFLPAYSATPGANYNPAYGGTPATPNPLYTAQQALTGDQALLAQAKALGHDTNQALYQQYTRKLPGYEDMANQLSANNQSLLSGNVPDDVRYALEQGAAERGAGRGMVGGDITNLDYLRGLGLTSLDLQQKGAKGFEDQAAMLKDIPFFDFSKYYVTPEQEQAAATAADTNAAALNPAAADAAKKKELLQGLNTGAATPGAAGTPAWGDPVIYDPNKGNSLFS